MYHEYPYTTYYNDIDKLCKCLKALNIYLDTHGDYLRLINGKTNEVMSSVKVSYADKALTDNEGRDIRTYLVSAGTSGNSLVFTRGNNEVISFEVPFAEHAAKDTQDKDILDYVYNVSISGNKVRILNGDGTAYELTVPFATQAAETVDGIDLTTLAMDIVTDGRELVLKDTRGRELSRITPNFAVVAQKDVDNDDIKTTYANSMTQTPTTLKLIAKDGTVLDEETINYAVASLKDTDGNLFLSDYAEKIVVDGNQIGVEAHDGTRLATITVPFATLATDASNAIENVQVSGDQIIFTTYAGQTFAITAPYAVKAQKDDNGNTIKETYFADVSNDTDAGTITFYDALGQVLAEIHNGVITRAIYDNYDNPLAGYIKAIGATVGSDYLTATHGDGTVDSIKVNYAEHAYMDTNNNVIKNTYVKRLAIVEDTDDGKWKLLAFNGDNPEALLFALEIVAERAKKDMNGKLLTSYLAHIDTDGDEVISKDGEDNEVDRITVPFATNATNAEFAVKDDKGKVIHSFIAGGTLNGTDLTLYDGDTTPVNVIDLSSLGGDYSLQYFQSNRELDLLKNGVVKDTIKLGFAVPTGRRLQPIYVSNYPAPSYTETKVWEWGDGATLTVNDNTRYVFYYGLDGQPIELNAMYDATHQEIALTPNAFSHRSIHNGNIAINEIEFMSRADNMPYIGNADNTEAFISAKGPILNVISGGRKLYAAIENPGENVTYYIYRDSNTDKLYMLVIIGVDLVAGDTFTMPTRLEDGDMDMYVTTHTSYIKNVYNITDIPTLPSWANV